MSADNWTYCPRCKAMDEKADKERAAKALEQYGQVTPEVFMKIMKDLERVRPEPLQEMLREDYEIGIRDGIFSIGYSACCRHCGFAFKFKHEEALV